MKETIFSLFFFAAMLLPLPGAAWVDPVEDGNEKWFHLSLGYGIPYGNIGLNIEVNPLLPKNLHHLNEHFGFSMGIGCKRNAPLFAIGVNFYPMSRRGRVVPHLSFFYGKVDRVADEWDEDDEDSVEALGAGAGLSLNIGSGFSLRGDLLWLFHIYDEFDPDEINGRFKFAMGARYGFESPYADQFSGGEGEGGPSFLQLGLGMGIPYGGVGVNLEFSTLLPGKLGQRLHRCSSLLIGSGFSGAGSAYSIGLRIYPMGKERSGRPRFGFHYGTVAIYEWWGGESSNIEGMALSAGLFYKIGRRWAVDGDLIYIAHVFGWDQDDLDSLIKISVGVRYLL